MKKYLINYCTGAGNEWVEGTLEDAMKIADEGASHTQENIVILLDDEEVAIRSWYGYDIKNDEEDGIEHENPISFGSFGFYDDWAII